MTQKEYTMNTQAEKDEVLNDALVSAFTDIKQWQQLAKYQRTKMDQNLGWCPTQAAIEASESVISKIRLALEQIHNANG